MDQWDRYANLKLSEKQLIKEGPDDRALRSLS
jgi:hypothetical protein